MLAILPAALACLAWLFSRVVGRRDAFLFAAVTFGFFAACSTELLGALHLLRPWPVFIVWMLIAVGAGWAAWRRPAASFVPPRLGWLDWGLLAGIATIAAIVGLTAVLSPPNSADAMSYHLPRVIYWVQAHSVSFFPTSYYNQIMLQPMTEYLMLQTYLLSGGDHYVNCVSCFAFCGSLVGVSAIARQMGAQPHGQILAALVCATLPNGILQASGAKNDWVLAFWLVCYVYFLLRYLERPERLTLAATSISLALALFTKGTAYLYAPALTVGFLIPLWRSRKHTPKILAAFALCILVVNGPLFWRNYHLCGSVLGFDSAQGDGFFRWRNERFGVGVTASNALRHLSEQIPARSDAWNRRVYNTIVDIHKQLSLDPNDPATTWRWEKYAPPRNANHEANGNSKWHLLLFVLSAPALLLFARRNPLLLGLWCGVAFGFVLFCAYLKWQPFMARLELPLFVLGGVVPAVLIARLRWPVMGLVLCLFLLNASRPFLFQNWTRPLRGPHSLFTAKRDDNYFSDMGQWDTPNASMRSIFGQAVALTQQSGCRVIGIDISQFQLEYPYEALLVERDPEIRFVHAGVDNISRRYEPKFAPRPCAVLCMNCAGNDERRKLYADRGEPTDIHGFLLYLH